MPSVTGFEPLSITLTELNGILGQELEDSKDVFRTTLREHLRNMLQKHHDDLLCQATHELEDVFPEMVGLKRSSQERPIAEDEVTTAGQSGYFAQDEGETTPRQKHSQIELSPSWHGVRNSLSARTEWVSHEGGVDAGAWTQESRKGFGVYCNPVKIIVGHPRFEFVCSIMIFLYVAFMAAEAQYDGERVGYIVGHIDFKNPPAKYWERVWLTGACIFNVFFVLELCMRIVAAQSHFVDSPWLWFDTVLVVLGVINLLDSLKLTTLFDLDVRVIRIVRILRVLRLVKVLKRSSALHSLFILFRSIRAAVGASVWSFVLILLIILGAGLLIQQLLLTSIEAGVMTDRARIELFEHFGTFSKTVVTMFELTTANWPPVCRMLMTHIGDGWGYAVVFYRCVFCFAVVNVIGAVFIAETNRVVAADDEVASITKDRAARQLRDTMRSLFEKLDTDGSGLVTWDEFTTVIEEDVTVSFMNTLDLNKEDCRLVFVLLDDGAQGLTHEEFYEGMKNIKGYAKRIDVAIVLKMVRRLQISIDKATGNALTRSPKATFRLA